VAAEDQVEIGAEDCGIGIEGLIEHKVPAAPGD
jgi:hypothetical protein